MQLSSSFIHAFFENEKRSIGTGNMMVLFFSAEMLLRVCRYRSCKAPGLSVIISLAALRAALAFCSPSAAITWHDFQNILISTAQTSIHMRIFSTHSSKSKYLKCTAKICVELRSYEHIISITRAPVPQKNFSFQLCVSEHFSVFNVLENMFENFGAHLNGTSHKVNLMFS